MQIISEHLYILTINDITVRFYAAIYPMLGFSVVC